jgi:hypothetical protein
MDRIDSSLVVRSADVIESLATYNCLMKQHLGALDAALETAENLFDIAIWYKNDKIAIAVLKVYTEGLKACGNGNKNTFPGGVRALRRSAKISSRKLTESGLKWPRLHMNLESIAREVKTKQAKRQEHFKRRVL